MLTEKDALRHEIEHWPKKNGKLQPWHVWHFKCRTPGCNNVIKLRKANLATATGKCKVCNARKEPFRALYNYLILTCKHRTPPVLVELSFDEFIEFMRFERCHYCDQKVNWSSHQLKKHGGAYNLDRKDNEGPYSVNDCVVCCWFCNRVRQNHFTYEEFMLLKPGLVEIQRRKNGNDLSTTDSDSSPRADCSLVL